MEMKILPVTALVVYEAVTVAALVSCQPAQAQSCVTDPKPCHEDQHTHSEIVTSNVSTNLYPITLAASSPPPMPAGVRSNLMGQSIIEQQWADTMAARHPAYLSTPHYRNAALLDSLSTSTSSTAPSA